MTTKTWTQLALTCKETQAELISNYLSAYDALAVTIVDGSGHEEIFQYTPTDSPIWKKSKILALFNNQDEAIQASQMLDVVVDDKLHFAIEEITDKDWVRETQKSFPAQSFGQKSSLYVIPSWEQQGQFKPPYVRIDPGVAFGTGTHPTTGLCLSWLADHPPIDLQVIDYGCGSGILALAALALKAQHVFATDHDDMAIEATMNNANLNNFVSVDNLHCSKEVPDTLATADLVMANILANPLIELAPTLTQLCKANGTLLLSGLLSMEVDQVLSHYPEFTEQQRYHLEDWSAIVLQKN